MAFSSPLKSQSSGADRLTTLLADAIHSGDSSLAKDLIEEVLNRRVKLAIKIPSDHNQEKEFGITVQIEDRLTSGTKFELLAKASDSIADLKRKVWELYKFPIDVQRWIIGKKIPEDGATLRNCGVNSPGHTVFLYIVTTRSTLESGNRGQQVARNSNSLESILMSNSMSFDEQPKGLDFLLMNSDMEGKAASEGNSKSHISPPPIPKRIPLQDAYNHDSEETKVVSNTLMHVIPPVLSPAAQPSSQNARRSQPKVESEPGWHCTVCTFFNLPTRPGCEMCSTNRPESYIVPDNYQMTDKEMAMIIHQEELERMTRQDHEISLRSNFEQFRALDDLHLVLNTETFTCPICFDDVDPMEGVVLRDCLHQFCKECIKAAVTHSEEPTLTCPYQDDNGSCDSVLQEREIRALVTEDVFVKYLQRSLDQAESQEVNSFHCKTTDCKGWCVYHDEVNFFKCPICMRENCLTCKVIHEGMNCKEYQADLASKAIHDEAAKKTQDLIQKMVDDGIAMHCSCCRIIVQKKDGCDWIKCSVCKTELCWVTKGPRWGPRGNGDTSGGCRCGIKGRCHPNCGNCH